VNNLVIDLRAKVDFPSKHPCLLKEIMPGPEIPAAVGPGG
jgi:hypothetical protein